MGKRPLWETAMLEMDILGTVIMGNGYYGNVNYEKRPLWKRAILGTAI